MPTFKGPVSEEEVLQLIAYIKSLGAAGRRRDRRGQMNTDTCRAGRLPERRLRRQVVAADDRPQADRAPLPGLDHASCSCSAASSPSLIRLELLTPAGDLVQADTYNKLFTMHGIVMVFFFLIPSIPAVLGNFLVPMMIGARDLAFPRLNLLSWYIYMRRRGVHAVGDARRRRRHRLDLLHAVQHARPRTPT